MSRISYMYHNSVSVTERAPRGPRHIVCAWHTAHSWIFPMALAYAEKNRNLDRDYNRAYEEIRSSRDPRDHVEDG